jgi:hypothetical protein
MRMMKVVVVWVALVTSMYGISQGIRPSGGKSMGMANASVCTRDVWAYHNNPGAIGSLDNFAVGLSYENRFCLKELQNQSLALLVPLKFGVFSFGGHSYGYSQYRSIKSGLGYSFRLAEGLYAGVQLNYQGIRLSQNYGSRNSITAESGLYFDISENWVFGAAVFNLGRSKLSSDGGDRFSTLMRLGAAYSFSDKLLFSAEMEKNIDYFLRMKIGMEYEAIDGFVVLGGIASSPLELTFGFGIEFKQCMLNCGSSYDQTLGWSPNVSFVLKRSEN